MRKREKMIVAMRGRPLTPKRTDYGKTIRKDYENHRIEERRTNIQRLEPRRDGICNTITTVQKDTLILGKVEMMKRENKAFTYVTEKEDGYATKKGDEDKNYVVAAITKVEENDCIENLDEERLSLPDFIEQRECNTDEKSVEDYLYTASDGEQYGIFKLSPRECGRLMGVLDKDIDKMLAANSNSQCYKQFGNSIVVPVLCAIFSQLHIEGITPWNRRSEEEREVWINPDNLHVVQE